MSTLLADLALLVAVLAALPLLFARAFFEAWLAPPPHALAAAPSPPPAAARSRAAPSPPQGLPLLPRSSKTASAPRCCANAGLCPSLSARMPSPVVRRRSPWPRRLFLLSFALSLDVLVLAVLEVAGALGPAVRAAAWRVVLTLLVATQLLLLPAAGALLAARSFGLAARPCAARLAALAALATFLWLFWRLGAVFPLIEREPPPIEAASGETGLMAGGTVDGGALPLLVAACLGRLGVLGVAAAAILSGYGAVATPFGYLSALLHEVSEADVRAKKHAVQRLLERLQAIRRQSAKLEAAAIAATSIGSVGASFAFSASAAAAAAPAAAQTALQASRRDVRVAEALQSETALEYSELVQALERQRWSRTGRGRLLTLLGYLLSAYAVAKTGGALTSILLQRGTAQPNSDPVTRVLELVLVWLLGVPRDAAACWLQPVSFCFVGTLVCVSVRGFLTAAARAAEFASRSLDCLGGCGWGCGGECESDGRSQQGAGAGAGAGASAGGSGAHEAVVLLLASLMGAYCVSVLLLLRMNVPEEFRRGITRAIGANVRFQFFERFFNVVFLLSILAASVAHAMTAALRSSRVSVSPEEREDFDSSAAAAPDEQLAIDVLVGGALRPPLPLRDASKLQ